MSRQEQIAASIFPDILKREQDRTAHRITFSNITDDDRIDELFEKSARKAARKSLEYAEIFIQESKNLITIK